MRKCIYSWVVIENEYAIKQIDKSFYDYGETIIPIKIRKFFDIQSNSCGDEVDISISFKNSEYDSKIRFENNFNRSKLTLGRNLQRIIIDTIKEAGYENNYNNNQISAKFTKVKKNKYELSLSIDISI